MADTFLNFPPEPRFIYERAPLVSVICQVRFPTILRIGVETPADFQEKIRKAYPLYSVVEPRINLPPELQGALPSQLASLIGAVPNQTKTHRFESEDHTKIVGLAPNSLAITDNAYHHWEEFREQVMLAEQALMLYEPSFYSRIGLRYQDRFVRSELGLKDHPWANLIRESFLGPLADDALNEFVAESIGRTSFVAKNIPGGRANVQYRTERVNDELCFVLDVDGFTQERCDPNDTSANLDKLHGIARAIFRHAIKDELHNAMGPKPRE